MEFNATFLVSIISFVIFVLIMNKIFYLPMANIVSKRENIIEENIDYAQKINADAENLLKKRDSLLLESESNSNQIISNKIAEYNKLSKQKIAEASDKSHTEIKTQKNILSEEYSSVTTELNSNVENLAGLISSKILGFEVDITENNRMKEV